MRKYDSWDNLAAKTELKSVVSTLGVLRYIIMTKYSTLHNVSPQ